MNGLSSWYYKQTRKTKRVFWWGIVLLALVYYSVGFGVVGALGSTLPSVDTSGNTGGVLVVASPTTASASQQSSQTATPTTSTVLERPVIGSTEPTFDNAYGKPTSHETYSNGSTGEIFATGNRMIDTFAISLEPGTVPGTNLVYGIYISAPVNRPWDIAAGLALCNSYLPSDTVMGKPRIITEAGGVQMYYREGNSASLAASVDPSYFFDGRSHQPVKPGTINASYSYADTQGFTISMCSLLFGTSADLYQS